MFESSSDAFIKVDQSWIRVSAIQAVTDEASRTFVQLQGGACIQFNTGKADQIIAAAAKAMDH